jgi:hypothetical protein
MRLAPRAIASDPRSFRTSANNDSPRSAYSWDLSRLPIVRKHAPSGDRRHHTPAVASMIP